MPVGNSGLGAGIVGSMKPHRRTRWSGAVDAAVRYHSAMCTRLYKSRTHVLLRTISQKVDLQADMSRVRSLFFVHSILVVLCVDDRSFGVNLDSATLHKCFPAMFGSIIKSIQRDSHISHNDAEER